MVVQCFYSVASSCFLSHMPNTRAAAMVTALSNTRHVIPLVTVVKGEDDSLSCLTGQSWWGFLQKMQASHPSSQYA